MAKRWPIDALQPDDAIIKAAAQMIRQDGVVVMPTSGLYGLGADAFSATAHQHIYRVKARSSEKALLVLIADMDALGRITPAPNAMASHLMRHFWPGGITFLLPAHPGLPGALTAGSGKIGVRLVAHPVAAALVKAAGSPLTGTSANRSGAGGCASVDQIDIGLLNQVDGVLDAGPLAGGPGSTVVDATGSAPVILRQGAVPARTVMACYDDFKGRARPV